MRREGIRIGTKAADAKWCSPVALANAIAVKGWGTNPIGQTKGADTANKPGGPAHIEAEPRVKSREVVQKLGIPQTIITLPRYSQMQEPAYHPILLWPTRQ